MKEGKKMTDNTQEVAKNKHNYWIRTGYYSYMYVSKIDWMDRVDLNGNKICIPPAHYEGRSLQVHCRNNAHNTDSGSAIFSFLIENNLKRNTHYYFDCFVNDWSIPMEAFRMKYRLTRIQAEQYLDAIEYVSKIDCKNQFVLNGIPLIDRFESVWGDNYKNYTMERKRIPEKDDALLKRWDDFMEFMNNANIILPKTQSLNELKNKIDHRGWKTTAYSPLVG